jgi:hypothetical protein
MPLRYGALHDALLDPGNAEKARLAAEEQAQLDRGLADLGRGIERLELATKAEFATVRREMAEMKASIIQWNVGTMVALAAIITLIMRFT